MPTPQYEVEEVSNGQWWIWKGIGKKDKGNTGKEAGRGAKKYYPGATTSFLCSRLQISLGICCVVQGGEKHGSFQNLSSGVVGVPAAAGGRWDFLFTDDHLPVPS